MNQIPPVCESLVSWFVAAYSYTHVCGKIQSRPKLKKGFSYHWEHEEQMHIYVSRPNTWKLSHTFQVSCLTADVASQVMSFLESSKITQLKLSVV